MKQNFTLIDSYRCLYIRKSTFWDSHSKTTSILFYLHVFMNYKETTLFAIKIVYYLIVYSDDCVLSFFIVRTKGKMKKFIL